MYYIRESENISGSSFQVETLITFEWLKGEDACTAYVNHGYLNYKINYANMLGTIKLLVNSSKL